MLKDKNKRRRRDKMMITHTHDISHVGVNKEEKQE
jgi:hypothetical protein